MSATRCFPAFLLAVWFGVQATPASAGLLTVDQAVDLSHKTGRPILAVGGSVN
jgi:hypothetical protein